MSVASKNLYDLLGNDVEGSDAPAAPLNPVTKTSTKTGKANADGTAPIKSDAAPNSRSAPRGGFNASETAFRDGGVGPGANRRKPTDETRGGGRGGRGARARGGRGATHHRNADDRHSKNVAPGSEKQAAQSWGAQEGEAELKDEQAGEAIAQTEQKDAEAEDVEAEDKEPEIKQITLEAYLAEQAEKKAALNAAQAVRKANEGDDKKWAGAKPLAKQDDEDFIPSSGGKKQRERVTKQKNTLEYDGRWQESNTTTTERPRGGGRGGARGGAERGERRGPRGGGARGAPRGGPNAAPRGAPQAGPRGGRGAAPINPNDASAFPALGQ